MSIQTPESSDRLRTNWTTKMDLYFIDLMLEQVDRGNRIDDHLFSKRAWKHMTSLFTAKYGCQYNKDTLKNRHKTLWKLYKAVQNLLNQNGFSWDETEQMVAADDRVWNNYIKEHPLARSYRTKSIPCFSYLCKVFGNVSGGIQSPTTSVPGEDSVDNLQLLSSTLCGNRDSSVQQDKQLSTIPSSPHLGPEEGMVDAVHEMGTSATTLTNGKDENNDISTENVMDVLQVEVEPNILHTTFSKSSRTYWQPPMDNYFIELMVDQVRKGNQFDGAFRKRAWMLMLASFNAKFGFKFDVDIMKNRYKTLKKQYNAIKILLEQRGFLWDYSRQMVSADDQVWHDYIKVHPDAKQYITRPVPYYQDLCVIFRDTAVDETYSNPGHIVNQNDEQPQAISVVHRDPNNIAQERSSDSGEDTDISDHQFATASDSQQFKRTRRRSNEDALVALPEMATAVTSSHLSEDINTSDQQKNHQFMTPSFTERSEEPTERNNDDESMMDALREMTNVVTLLSDKRKEESINCISQENVIYELQAVPDIDEDLILDACDFLEDEQKAKIFLSLDVRLRKKWLTRKLRPQ